MLRAFVVSPAKATPGLKILIQIAVTTAQAYNNYGGKSLYGYNSTSSLPATQVSFDRPHSDPSNFAFDAWQGTFVRWLARNGFAADFCTSVDLHRDTAVLSGYQLFLTSGHDEYWSREMRQRLNTFVAGGGNAAIFSGNTCWWQSRFASNAQGVAHRTLVCYKSRTTDPDTREAYKTVNWIGLRPPEPENVTIGLSWSRGASWTNAYARPNTPYVVQQGAHWVFAGTGLNSGTAFGGAYSGYEMDTLDVRKGLDGRVYPSAVDGSPSTLRVLALADASTWDAQAKALGLGGEKSGFGAMSIHSRGGSAGAVFNGGTIDWATALQPELDGQTPTPFSRMTRNIVSRLQNRHMESAEVRQWHNLQSNGDGSRYFFTTGETGPTGALLDGGVFNAYAAPITGTAPVYRFKYPQINGDGERYIYSLNAALGYGWVPDGIAFHAFANWTADSVAIYQHHAAQTNGDGWRFFFSPSTSEPGWILDGLSFYAPVA